MAVPDVQAAVGIRLAAETTSSPVPAGMRHHIVLYGMNASLVLDVLFPAEIDVMAVKIADGVCSAESLLTASAVAGRIGFAAKFVAVHVCFVLAAGTDLVYEVGRDLDQ